MKARVTRIGALAGMLALTGALLTGCFAPPPVINATLFFSDLVGTVGEQGELKVSVLEMPDGGIAGLVVGLAPNPGLRYAPGQFRVTEVQGLNGFQVLATFIDNGTGEVRFVLVNPTSGVVNGDIALIKGDRLGGGDFDFQLQKVSLQLMAADGSLIPAAAYNLATGQAPPYYVKGGEGP